MMDVTSVQKYAADYGMEDVEVVKEASNYITAMENLDLENDDTIAQRK